MLSKFGGIGLGYIEADFCYQEINAHFAAFVGTYEISALLHRLESKWGKNTEKPPRGPQKTYTEKEGTPNSFFRKRDNSFDQPLFSNNCMIKCRQLLTNTL